MNKQESITEFTIFWQIDFRVVAGQIQLTQTVSLWAVQMGNPPRRIGAQTWNLSHRKVGAGTLRVEHDHIVCDDAGLECLTVDLNEAIATMALSAEKRRAIQHDLREMQIGISQNSVLFGKENVSIRAVVDIPTDKAKHQVMGQVNVSSASDHALGAGTVSAEPNRFQPIFYIDQPDGYILLAETEDHGARHVVWTIKGSAEKRGLFADDLIRGGTPAFELDGWHMLRVHQDGERSADGDYLEFWVDQLSLGYLDLDNGNFPFNRLPTRFYIGIFPDAEDRTKLHGLKGAIKQLYFDPNDVCHGCLPI